MATTTKKIEFLARGVVLCTWDAFTVSGDKGGNLDAMQYPDKDVQVVGLPAGTTKIVIEGSNDDANWSTLNDPQGNALEFTADKHEQILENPRYIRPRLDTATGATSPQILIVSRSSLG